MAERAVEVVASGGDGVRLRLLGSACAGCGGCGGRCGLFAADADGELTLPAPGFALRPGQQLRLVLDDERLRGAAWRGYGRAWAGLLAGAVVGRALAFCFAPGHADLLTLAGLVSGTFVAVPFSKRHSAEPRLQADGGEPPSVPQIESPHP
jgi:hypothetical protein